LSSRNTSAARALGQRLEVLVQVPQIRAQRELFLDGSVAGLQLVEPVDRPPAADRVSERRRLRSAVTSLLLAVGAGVTEEHDPVVGGRPAAPSIDVLRVARRLGSGRQCQRAENTGENHELAH
jgi:hypothetical protein